MPTRRREDKVERAISAIVYIVTQHAARHSPLLDRLEREYTARFADPVDRARAILDRYRSAGQRGKTILLSTDCR
jgi:hypothetical protein